MSYFSGLGEKSTGSAVLINQEADYDNLPKLSFGETLGKFGVLGGRSLQTLSSFWKSLEDVSHFSVWAFASTL